MAYGADFAYIWRESATLVDKVLRGAKAADIPIQQATRFELMVNLQAAKALGVTIPQSFLTRADVVLEWAAAVLSGPYPAGAPASWRDTSRA